MIGLRGNSLLVGAVTAISLIVLLLCAVQISRFMRFGGLPYLARQIERDKPVSRETIARLVLAAEAVREAKICQSELVNGGLAVLLTELDYQNQDQNYNGWAASIERAEKFARFALGCLPTDGNLWLRLAMVQQAIGEQSEGITKLVTLSQLYAPAEGNVIIGRYRLYNRLTEPTLVLLSEPVAADLAVICSDIGKPLRRHLPAPGLLLTQRLSNITPDCSLLRKIGSSEGTAEQKTKRPGL